MSIIPVLATHSATVTAFDALRLTVLALVTWNIAVACALVARAVRHYRRGILDCGLRSLAVFCSGVLMAELVIATVVVERLDDSVVWYFSPGLLAANLLLAAGFHGLFSVELRTARTEPSSAGDR